MANEKTLIRTLTEPTIILDDLEAQDMEAGTSTKLGSPKSSVTYSHQYGGAFPLIQINGTAFNAEQIVYLELRCEGHIPGVSVTFNVNDKSFYSTSFPKDGDVMTVFIRSKNDGLKPIRNDYDITHVSVSPRQGGGENTPEDMTISGILRIPGYHAAKCFSKSGTSMKTLLNIATDLNLGFATNEVDTSDAQTWICPFDKVSDFIYNTALASWKDKNSFYAYFIDHYYYLNFVNVNPLFSEKSEIEDSLGRELLFQDFGKDSKNAEFKGKVVLTNWDDMSSTNFFIQSYSLQNNSSSIDNTHGYRRYANFYDGLVKASQRIYSDPLTTPGSENTQVLLKGRPNENIYLQQVESKWMGVQYGKDGENCHANYNVARITNFQNNVHLDKMLLIVNLENVNFNLRRMQPIPVVIVIKKDFTRKVINDPTQSGGSANSTEPNRESVDPSITAEKTPFTIDHTISGNYVIKDIIYRYIDGEFKQECVLQRREWPVPPQSH